MKFVTNESLVTLLLGGVLTLGFDVFQDVRRHNIALAENNVRFAGYDAMVQNVIELRTELTTVHAKINELLEIEKKQKEGKRK
jgi:hypothetical protein